jgi:dTDP-4-amino-4,6-dideoxygalactose transaminase
MAEICAAMGLSNFDLLDDFVAINRRNHQDYTQSLAGLPGLSLLPYDESEQQNYQYVVLEVATHCPVDRDSLVAVLHAENVLARKYFWPGCHRMLPYRELYSDSGQHLLNTSLVADRVLVLPTGASISRADVNVIAQIISVACGS